MKKIILLVSMLFIASLSYGQCNESTHSNNPTDNWESCSMKANPNSQRGDSHWIKYDLGYIYPIVTSYVWNYNVSGQTTKGFKDVMIDYSIDGETWVELGTFTFQEASGSSIYSGFEGPDFGDVGARYILITALNNYGNSCYGLAECKFDIGADVVLGIEEIQEENSLIIFPNPTEDIIKLSHQDLEIEEIIIRSATGTELKRYGADFPRAIDVSYLPNGIYFIIANTKDNKFIVKKFIKIGG